jgi:hypothetical protein
MLDIPAHRAETPTDIRSTSSLMKRKSLLLLVLGALMAAASVAHARKPKTPTVPVAPPPAPGPIVSNLPG